jgi:hypothetical protein
MSAVKEYARVRQVKIGAIIGRDESSYDLTIEEDVLLGDPKYDAPRVVLLLARLVEQATNLSRSQALPISEAAEAVKLDTEKRWVPDLDWREFCRGAEGVSVEKQGVQVFTADLRSRSIRIRETPNTYELASIVRHKVPPDTEYLAIRTWRRNRAIHLLGFRIDRKDRMIAEAWIPKPGLNPQEFVTCLRNLAVECDLFEYTLTGRDSD